LSVSGGAAVVGAWNDDANGTSSGSAYLFHRDVRSGAWTQTAKFVPTDIAANDWCGLGVAVSGDTALAGSPRDDDNGLQSGSARTWDALAPIETYCTAGTSAGGCTAAISASGTPSASAATGFDLTAAGVEGGKVGLFFFGTNGRQANAWGNGSSLQCVVPPVHRGALLAGSGTAGACDGTFAYDLNARWTAKPIQNPGAGARVQAQLWYRDPASTSSQTTSLSDAIEFTVCP